MRFLAVLAVTPWLFAAEPNVFLDGRLTLIGESRIRYESRKQVSFGTAKDYDVALLRQRLGLSWKPSADFEFRIVGQDARAPLYGVGAPNSLRDGTDLYEAYVDLYAKRKKGFAARVGRSVLSYGDTRLIGSPQWANLTRSYDMARVQWKTGSSTFEALYISPVQIRIYDFNKPQLREHTWGTYNVLNKWSELYFLRHEQPGTQESLIWGGRLLLPAGAKWKLVVEPIVEQVSRTGPSTTEGALAAALSRKFGPVDLSLEFKYASSGFDQMYPAAHDKLGHEDLFGWRNLNNARAFAIWRPKKTVAVHFMYNANWLVDPRVGAFNTQNRLISRDTKGTAPRWAGQEFDSYVHWNYRKFSTVGAGFGVYANGGFFHATSPDRQPAFVYVFHTFTM